MIEEPKEISLVIITSEGVIGSAKECDDIDIPILYEVTGTVTHKEWYIDGLLPIGVNFSYDNNQPRLYGNIKMFSKQTVIPSNMFYPDEPLKFDGSNSMNNGDFIGSSYMFSFNIVHNYTAIDEETNIEDEKTAVSTVSIELNHLDNKYNTMFMKRYLDNPETDTIVDIATRSIRIKRREIPYDGVVYRKEDVGSLLSTHPGPFSICKGE